MGILWAVVGIVALYLFLRQEFSSDEGINDIYTRKG